MAPAGFPIESEKIYSVGERAQKTGKEGATNSKDPNGKLSLKERKFKAWIIGELGGRKDRGNGRVVRTVTAVDMRLYFPTIFLLFPLLLP